MHPSAVSTGILGVVDDINEMERSVDVHSQTALVFFTSLAFVIPAISAWRMKRLWHCCLFGALTLVCMCYHYCNVDDQRPRRLNTTNMQCSPAVTHFVTNIFFVAVNFFILQMAFLVMGPEDPHMQWLSVRNLPGNPNHPIPHHAPRDAVLTARVLPALVLCAFRFGHTSRDAEMVHWQSVLLSEMLLLVCCIKFWLHQDRKAHSADVLLHFKFWHRLLHHCFIPAMMLFWIFCITGLAELQVLHSIWHVIVAFFAHNLVRTVLNEESTTFAKVLDQSSMNPNVAHVFLGAVALIMVPTAVVGASFDWCSTSATHWPTIAIMTHCQPGGYFVAIVAVPAFAAMATVFWLIASTQNAKSSWTQLQTTKSWEIQPEKFLQEQSCDSQQRALSNDLGCLLGYSGCVFGLLAALIMKGEPLQNMMSLLSSIMSMGLLMIAFALTVCSAEASTRIYLFRYRLTVFLCLPIMVLYIVLYMAEQCLPYQYQPPHFACAITEYVVVVLLTFWPMTWISEVQATWQLNGNGSFSWPTTAWRFV